ncbi:hypothetical protein EHS25_008793 [Saitozyma podzolica]|uniref:RhoGAP-domain-containing protein n=1 Tax=Saitozyma podzolica TaxID=1890683 RepID=A0A427YML6_9TREE|nr:hypothetical protein EHS25_008793 [Saitozyma podzolica]
MSASTSPMQQHLAATSSTPRPHSRPSPNASPQQGSPRSSSPRSGSAAAIDVETVLKSCGGDLRKALEAVVAERNALQAQNSQLWKLIEKQRAQSVNLVSDNDRLRVDRERANTKLLSAGLEPVNGKRLPNSSSAIGLGLRSEPPAMPPAIRRHNSDRDDKASPSAKESLEVPPNGHLSAPTSPGEHPQSLLPSAMPERQLRRESRMTFPPEVTSYISLADSPRDMQHSIPPVPIPSSGTPSSGYSASPNPSSRDENHPHSVPPPSSRPLAVMTEVAEPEDLESPSRESSVKSPVSRFAPQYNTSEADLARPSVDTTRSENLPTPRQSLDQRSPADSSRPSRSPPRLAPFLLPHTRLCIPHSTVYSNAVGRDVLCFIVSITVRPPNAAPATWNVAKLFSAFIDLDTKIKARSGKSRKDWKAMVAPLPDGKAWKDFAPSKIDQRKAALETYLQSLLVAPLSDKTDLCEFLSTDPVQAKDTKARKEGYLTKKGKNFGGWKTRYFVLDGPVMEYFESRGGSHLGSITITGAQIGRQNRPADSSDERDFRHAFLIIEAAKKGATNRHVLCADSDMDRDSWIEMLVRHVDPEPAPLATRSRSDSRKSSKDAAQPMSKLAANGDAKFAAAYFGHVSFLRSPFVLAASSRHDPRPSKRQSMMPPRGASHSAAYLSKLSSEGLSAPPGYQEKERDRKAKSGRFWPSFGKQPEKIARPVFAIPLNESIAVASVAGLPAIVFRCIEWLEAKHAEEEEGIYRLSGSSAVIKGLKDRFDSEGDVNLLQLDERWDPHAIAGLLKSFLRELPTSLLTRELHPRFLAVMDLIETSARVAELSRLVSDLPPPNYALLRALTAHLILIVRNAPVNKMTLRNIGIVFSPTLGIPAGIFSELVSHFGAIFDDEPMDDVSDGPQGKGNAAAAADATAAVGEGGAVLSVPLEGSRRNRNSVLYQKVGIDTMLGLGGRALDPALEDSTSEASDLDIDGEDADTEDLEGESRHPLSVPSSESLSAPNASYSNGPALASPNSVPRSEAYPSAAALRSAKAAARAAEKGLTVGTPEFEQTPRKANGLPASPRPPPE